MTATSCVVFTLLLFRVRCTHSIDHRCVTVVICAALQSNHDYCDSCDGRGHFLCCDGCPRSFHFSCLDPPLELDEVPAESWYCNVCAATRVSKRMLTSTASSEFY